MATLHWGAGADAADPQAVVREPGQMPSNVEGLFE